MVRFVLDQGQITFLPQKITDTQGSSDTGEAIRLVNHTLMIEPVINKIHPDILALICTLAFYNYLHSADELIYPRAVSPQFLQILELHNFHPTMLNDDPLVKPRFVPKDAQIALSWGGGFDSWAAYLLQPELYSVIIHHHNPDSPIPKPDLVNLPEYITVTSNTRQLSELANKEDEHAGWVVWSQVLIPTLWLAEKYKLGAIGIGGNLGSVFLKNGRQYHPAHLKPNLWFKTFQLVGLPLYLPLAGLTDLAVYRFLEKRTQPAIDFSQIKYCSLSTTTENCHQCLKCQRRELLLGRDLTVPVEAQGPTVDYLQRGKEEYAIWIDKYYQPALQLVPPVVGLKTRLKQALQQVEIPLLPPEYEVMVEHYGWDLA